MSPSLGGFSLLTGSLVGPGKSSSSRTRRAEVSLPLAWNMRGQPSFGRLEGSAYRPAADRNRPAQALSCVILLLRGIIKPSRPNIWAWPGNTWNAESVANVDRSTRGSSNNHERCTTSVQEREGSVMMSGRTFIPLCGLPR